MRELAAAVLLIVIATQPRLRRWFLGRPLDGHLRTNATWNRRATKVLHPTGYALWWHHWRQRDLAALRTVGTVGVTLTAVGLAVAKTETIVILAAGALVFLALHVPAAIARGRDWRHHRTWVQPLHRALTYEMGIPPARLEIAPDRSRVIVGLPVEFTGTPGQRQAINRAVAEKLAIPGHDVEWSLDHDGGKKPQAMYTRSKGWAGDVAFSDIRMAIEGAESHEIVMGLEMSGDPVTVSVDNDSPHLGLSMGSGDGKSTVAKNMAAQLLYHGALLMVLDIKLISHMWARGLPNVSYAGTPAEIESALVWLAAEVGRRNKVAQAAADVEGVVHANVGPRIFLIAEELNATQNRLKAWWNRDMEMKGRSPGSEALDEVMFLGRQVKANVLQIGQRLSVKASGSGDARENLGVLVFSDPTAAAWKMLCSQHVMPPATGHLGRLQVVTRKAVRETQGAYFTGQQARDFALSGTVGVPRPDMPCVTSIGPVPPRPQLGTSGADLPVDLRQPPPVLSPGGAVTLREAVGAGLFVSLDAARKAAQRHLEPVGERSGAHLFDLVQIHDLIAGKVKVYR